MNNSNTLIDFLVQSHVLKFGEFKTKSGRLSPYFMNFGAVCRGTDLRKLCSFYSERILINENLSPNVIFGPAYKGVPLAVTIAAQLDDRSVNHPIYFSFNRKEQKSHGEGGSIVGRNLKPGDRVVIVEDVVTAGTTLKEVVPFLRSYPDVLLEGLIICVDRQEKIDDKDTVSAVQRLEEELDIEIISLLKISDILEYLTYPNSSGLVLSSTELEKASAYLQRYGIS
jgi:orotate phosphoribosyltransferase